MKYIAFSILVYLFIPNVISQTHEPNIPIPDLKTAVKTIMDCNCIIGSFPETLSPEDEVMIGCVYLMDQLDFKVLDSLFESQSNAVKLYSFFFMCKKFRGQLTKHHLKILDSKENINVYKREIAIVGELAQGIYDRTSSKAKDQLNAEIKMEAELRKQVSDFITTYAKYPESYESKDFSGFQFYSSNGSESKDKIFNYVISHRYRIKNAEGKLVDKTAIFKLTSKLRIMIADEDYIEFLNGDDPIVGWWLEEFGKKLTAHDKKKLGIK